jgi:hypothetical protein
LYRSPRAVSRYEVNFRERDDRTRLEALGNPILMMLPADFHKLIVEETEGQAKVITFANIKAN